MDAQASSDERLVSFKSPKRFLAGLDPAIAAKVVASAADVALIVDDGIIKDIALGNYDLSKEGYGASWRGKKWIETVTIESRPKIEELLKTTAKASPHWRQVNHPSASGADIPIRYTAVKTGPKGRLVALGRDLRSVSALQQRLVEAHQGLERDYDRLRDAEAQYQTLFHTVAEPVLIVDAETYEIEDANPAADRHFSALPHSLIGASLFDPFEKKAKRAIEVAVADALANGSAISNLLRSRNDGAWKLSVSPFRQDDETHLIVRVLAEGARDSAASAELMGVLENIPDGLVVASQELFIAHVNKAFSDMTRLSGNRQAIGRRLDDFLGRSGTDVNVLMSSMRNHGFVRNFATVLRDQFGAEERVEVSAVAAPVGDGEVYGFSIRNVARRLEAGPRIGEELPSSVDQLTGLVGKVSLKEIVRESTDLIEKLCIEAALEITEDNRASAAEMLGLSRQGLYSKLKRFGFDE
ncbi:MAG: transcriptional regulator PpsR [Pseudomonadota bacterium]